MDYEDKLMTLAEDYGIETVLEMCDINPEKVLDMLVEGGLLDLGNFFREETRDEN